MDAKEVTRLHGLYVQKGNELKAAKRQLRALENMTKEAKRSKGRKQSRADIGAAKAEVRRLKCEEKNAHRDYSDANNALRKANKHK